MLRTGISATGDSTVKGTARIQVALTAVLVMIALGACGYHRQLPGDSQVVDGMAIYLGVMQIAGTTTYGNFFPMQGEDAWRIRLTIERPNIAHATEADFRYRHAVGH